MTGGMNLDLFGQRPPTLLAPGDAAEGIPDIPLQDHAASSPPDAVPGEIPGVEPARLDHCDKLHPAVFLQVLHGLHQPAAQDCSLVVPHVSPPRGLVRAADPLPRRTAMPAAPAPHAPRRRRTPRVSRSPASPRRTGPSGRSPCALHTQPSAP